MYNALFFQVIWAIGISMVIMGGLIYLPYNVIMILGMLIVFGHNLLDIPESAPGFRAGFLWNLMHHGVFARYPITENHTMLIVYPFLPWTGLMMLGFCLGKLYGADFDPEKRRKLLKIKGAALIILFILLRFTNTYGDPGQWSSQKNALFTIFSFTDVNKYPPSLLYLCITIGPALLMLAWLEKIKNRVTDMVKVFGRVALFYYILHIYLIHTLCMINFFIQGHQMSEAIEPGAHFPFYFLIPGEGYSLPVVYLIWALVIVLLYPVCKWYDKYKTNHMEKKWLSYL
jgi:uncharacterized membrane protein